MSKPINIDRLLEMLAETLAHKQPSLRAANDAASDSSPAAASAGPLHTSLPTDDAEFCEIVVEFVERLHEQLDAMRRAWADRDLDELARLAHWLKGSGGTAGFGAFTIPAQALQKLAQQRQLDQIPAAISELEDLADRIIVPTIDHTDVDQAVGV
jgi:HPt (histidine-containing phosphotransfer) domain-containing protein